MYRYQIIPRKCITNLLLVTGFALFIAIVMGCGKTTVQPEVEPPKTDGKEVNVLDFKQATKNDHEMIQRAIDYASEKQIKNVWIPKGIYMIDAAGVNGEKGLRLRGGITLKMHDEAILKAIANNSGNYAIIRIYDAADVKIIGGTILGDRNEHTGTSGEWGMGVDIQSSKDVVITNTIIKDCWGDGIYVAGARISTNIMIDNVVCEANRRQGISIVYADNVTIKNSTMSKTKGAAPQAGIDIEPNVGQYASNIKILNTKFLNNTGPGLFVFAGTGKVSDVVVRDCVSEGNSHAGINLNGGNPALPERNLMNVRISNVVIKDNPLIGLYIRKADNVVLDTLSITDSKQRAVEMTFSKNVVLDSIVVQNVKTEAFYMEGSDEIRIKRAKVLGLSQTSIGWQVKSSAKVDIRSSSLNGGSIGVDGKDVGQLSINNVVFQGQIEKGLSFENVSNGIITSNSFENISKVPIYLNKSDNNTFKGNVLKNNSFSANNQFSQITITNTSKKNLLSENKAFSSVQSNKPKHVILFDNSTSGNISKDNVFEVGSYVTSPLQDDTGGLNQVN